MTEYNMPPAGAMLEGLAQVQDQITKAREGDPAALEFCLSMLEGIVMAGTVVMDDPRQAALLEDHGAEIKNVLGDKFPPKPEGNE